LDDLEGWSCSAQNNVVTWDHSHISTNLEGHAVVG